MLKRYQSNTTGSLFFNREYLKLSPKPILITTYRPEFLQNFRFVGILVVAELDFWDTTLFPIQVRLKVPQ